MSPDVLGQPLPEDLTELRATVTFTFQVWNVGQEKTPEELAESFQGTFSLDQAELAETLGRATDHEVTITPVAKAEGTRSSGNE